MDNLSTAVSSVQKFGWGAFKSLQKGYQEVVVQYKEAAAAAAVVVASNSSSNSGGGGGDGIGSKPFTYVARERPSTTTSNHPTLSNTNGNHREVPSSHQESSVSSSRASPPSTLLNPPVTRSSATPDTLATIVPSSYSKTATTSEPTWSVEDDLSETYSTRRKVDEKKSVEIVEVASEGFKAVGSDPLGVGFL